MVHDESKPNLIWPTVNRAHGKFQFLFLSCIDNNSLNFEAQVIGSHRYRVIKQIHQEIIFFSSFVKD